MHGIHFWFSLFIRFTYPVYDFSVISFEWYSFLVPESSGCCSGMLFVCPRQLAEQGACRTLGAPLARSGWSVVTPWHIFVADMTRLGYLRLGSERGPRKYLDGRTGVPGWTRGQDVLWV